MLWRSSNGYAEDINLQAPVNKKDGTYNHLLEMLHHVCKVAKFCGNMVTYFKNPKKSVEVLIYDILDDF